MPEILGDVLALAYVAGQKKRGSGALWEKSAFCGQKAKFAGQKKFIARICLAFTYVLVCQKIVRFNVTVFR